MVENCSYRHMHSDFDVLVCVTVKIALAVFTIPVLRETFSLLLCIFVL